MSCPGCRLSEKHIYASCTDCQQSRIHEQRNKRKNQNIERHPVQGILKIMPQHHRGKHNLNAQTDGRPFLPASRKLQLLLQPFPRPCDGPYGSKRQLKSALKDQIGFSQQKNHCRQSQSRKGVIGTSCSHGQPKAQDHDYRPHGRAGSSGEKSVAYHQPCSRSACAGKAKAQPPKDQIDPSADNGQVLSADGQQMSDPAVLVQLSLLLLHFLRIPQKHGFKNSLILRPAALFKHTAAMLSHSFNQRRIGVCLSFRSKPFLPIYFHRDSFRSVIILKIKFSRIQSPLYRLGPPKKTRLLPHCQLLLPARRILLADI